MWSAMFEVCAASPVTIGAAMAAAIDHGLPFWDAMLWATLEGRKCGLLFTEDFQDGLRLGGVTFVNPFLPGNAAFVSRALGKA